MLPIPFGNPATYAGHSGVDYPGHSGEEFPASGPGMVVSRGRNERGGFFIWVQYDGGPLVGYHHMNSHLGCPVLGARVQLGQRLGYVGWTGHVVPAGRAGAHLHSEVSGHATTAGYWLFFDRTRVVGSGSGAGTGAGEGSKPSPAKPAVPPQRKRKKMDGFILLVTKDDGGGIRRYLIDARLEAHREISQYKYEVYKNTGTPEIYGVQPVSALNEWKKTF